MSASMDALMEKIRVARETTRSAIPVIPDSVAKDAVASALIQASVNIEPTGIAICHDGKNFRMYSADAWTEPSQRGLLPWSPPRWPALVIVQADGSMTVASETGRATIDTDKPRLASVELDLINPNGVFFGSTL